MNGCAAPGERGFTLVELVVAVAIVSVTVAAGIGLSLSSRSLAVATALAEFDHLLDSTRTVARETDGATILFTPDAYGDGTEARVDVPGTDGTLTPTTLPVLHTRAVIEEVESLGKPPFAFVVHATGVLRGRPAFRAGDATTAPETGCPRAGAFHFVIRAAGAAADRFVPCRIDLAATGTVALITPPSATLAPLPTPCASCTTASVPPAPTAPPTCPPGFGPVAGGCAPLSNGPQYHVTASAASSALTTGGTDALTAQATLVNPLTAPPGTPASVPVAAQTTDAACTVAPPGSQPSGTPFTIAGVNAGACTVTVTADLSGTTGASADTATVVVTVTASPAPTPTPQACDLVQNGKCYHLIVGPTNQAFMKLVLPDVVCDGPQSECRYVDRVQSIQLTPFDVTTNTPASDPDHELLFVLASITAVGDGCEPFSSISLLPAPNPVQWPTVVIGAPVNPPTGLGEPSTFLTVNHIVSDPRTVSAESPWIEGTTIEQLRVSLSSRIIGSTYSFTYSGLALTNNVQWYPDPPGCDTLGGIPAENHYGPTIVGITFQIYQALP